MFLAGCRNRMGHCSPGRCPSTRHCCSREKRSRHPPSPEGTCLATLLPCASMRFRWQREGLLQMGKSIPHREEQGPAVGFFPEEGRGPPSPWLSECRVVQPSAPILNLRFSTRNGIVRRGGRSRFLFRKLLLECHFPSRILLAAGACVGHGELVMSSRILGNDFRVAFEWRDRVREAPLGIERHAQCQHCFRKGGIEIQRRCEMPNGVGPLAVTSRTLTEPEFRGRIRRINNELLLEFLPRLFGSGRSFRLRKYYPPQPEMNIGQLRVLLQDLPVDGCGFWPLVLRFQCLRFEFEDLVRVRRDSGQVLGCVFRYFQEDLCGQV